MIQISLTDFLDFLVATGTRKLTKVRQLRNRPEYHPVMDFWKEGRERIVGYHQRGDAQKRFLDGVLESLTDTKKQGAYPDIIAGYKKFLGTKQIQYAPSPKADWNYKELLVRVNPELILTLKDRPTVVKLYFKREPLYKFKIEAVWLLLALALENKLESGTDYGVLDIRRSRLYSSAEPDVSLAPLLFGEAENFIAIWNNLS